MTGPGAASISPADALRARLGPIGVWTAVGNAATAADEASFALQVESLGYGALWFGEVGWGKEAFVHAALLLAATERLPIATGIASIYARDPLATRQAAATLAEAHPDRFVLGLGISHPPSVSLRGHEYGKPVSAMREYLAAMAAADLRIPEPAVPAPIVLAALRPRMLELAAQHAAGAHPYFTPVEHTRRARAVLGPRPWLAPELMVVLEDDPESARAKARTGMARYLTLNNYRNNLGDLGFGPDDLAGGGSDRLVDAIVAWGDAETIAARVREHLDAGADHVCIQPLADNLPAQLAQLSALRDLLP